MILFLMHNQGLWPGRDLSDRDPRILEHPQLLAELSIHKNPAGNPGATASEPPSDMDQLKRQTALQTKRMEELTSLISGSLSMAGRSSANEVLEPDLANPFPRPSVFRSLAWPAAPDWAPLVPLEGIPLYQSMLSQL